MSSFVAMMPGSGSVTILDGAVVIGPVPPADPLRATDGAVFRHYGGNLNIWLNDAWFEFGVPGWYNDNSGGPVSWQIETCNGSLIAGPLSITIDFSSTFDVSTGQPRRYTFGSIPAGVYVLRHAGGFWRVQNGALPILGEESGPFLGKMFWRGFMIDDVRAATCPIL
jgi:hypothetical protein